MHFRSSFVPAFFSRRKKLKFGRVLQRNRQSGKSGRVASLIIEIHVIVFHLHSGTGMLASLQEGRNCVAVEADQTKLFHVQARYNQQGSTKRAQGKPKNHKEVLEIEGAGEDSTDRDADAVEDLVDESDDWGFSDSVEEEIVSFSEMEPSGVVHLTKK